MKPSLLPFFAASLLGLTAFLSPAFAQSINMTHPERMVESLDGVVALTPEQRIKAADIFQRQTAALLALPQANRGPESIVINDKARQEIRAMLTPQQWIKYALTPQSQGGGSHVGVENMTNMLNETVALTPEQKAKAHEIFQRYAEDVAMLPDEHAPGKNMELRRAANIQIRALLTPEQQQKFDSTPMMRGGGQMGGGKP